MVVARYDLNKTWNELIVAISIPTVLFAVSFVTLCIIMQSVKVGDDTKMRCQYCIGNSNVSVNSRYEVTETVFEQKIVDETQ